MVNERREKEKMAKITDEEFERVIDMLEKASIFKVITSITTLIHL